MSLTDSANWIKLHDVEPGRRAKVQRLSGHPATCHRLRELGFCEFAEIKILHNSGALLCKVCDSRICLSQQLAANVLVEPDSA